MQYIIDSLRTKQHFPQAANEQFRTHYNYLNKNFSINEELAISENNFDRFRNKKVLVVGGGPTTNEIQWSPADYDYILSCNHFFKHPVLLDVGVAVGLLSPEVNVNSEEFKKYWSEHPETIFCFDNPEVKKDTIQTLLERDSTRVVVATTRYKSDIGSVPILLILATLFKAAIIHVVGMDGMPPGKTTGDDAAHSFEPNKEMRSIHYNYNKYVEYYRQLWGYLRDDIGRDTKFVNLGHGHPYNISTLYNVV